MEKKEPTVRRSRVESLELYTLALLLQGNTKDLLEEFTQTIDVEALTSPPIARIVEALIVFSTANPVFLVKDFADGLPPELLPTLDEAFLWEVAAADDEDLFVREWGKTLSELKKSQIRHELTQLSQTADA